MNVGLAFLPFVSSLVSFVFAVLVLRRYRRRGGAHHLLWGIGMIFYGIGGFCEAYYGFLGWNPLIFRLWYLFGAMLVAAWLGQGTVYLLTKPVWANVLMLLLLIGSLYGAVRVFGAELDPGQMGTSLHTGSELSGRAILTPGVRALTPVFNVYGTACLVGGALYSACAVSQRVLRRAVALRGIPARDDADEGIGGSDGSPACLNGPPAVGPM
jgi:hypothetical protein